MIVRLRSCLLSCCLFTVVLSTGSPLLAQKSGAVRRDPVREKFLKINYIFNRELYALAVPEYERFLKDHPDFKDAAFVHYALALCHYNLVTRPQQAAGTSESGPVAEAPSSGKTTRSLRGAIKHLKEALRTRGFKSRAEATHLLGQCLLRIGDYRNAATAFRWVVAKGRSEKLEAAATLGLAETLYHQNNYSEAETTYRSLLQTETKSTPDRSRARFYLAMSLYHAEKSVPTESAAESATAGPSLSPAAEALAVFETLAGALEDPYRDDARYMAALILTEQDQHKRAAKRFEQLIRSGSKRRMSPRSPYRVFRKRTSSACESTSTD